MRRVGNDLVALGSAAVLAVYTAGYLRTRAAAERFAEEPAPRRPVHAAVVAAIQAAPLPADAANLAAGATKPKTTATPGPARAIAPRRSTPVRVEKTPATAASQPTSETPAPTPTPAAIAAMPATPTPLVAAPTTTAVTEPVTTPTAPTAPPAPVYKDGTYYGWGTSRHGDIQAAVVIEGGKIASASIAQCLTRYSCSWIAILPPQVVARQSPETDYVSGATQSTNAFYYAVVEALAKAK